MQDVRAVVLVEGESDQRALDALAVRRGLDLAAEGVAIVAMGGAQAIARHLDHFGPTGVDVRLAGLCDAGEERGFRRGLERARLGTSLTRADMERLGFFVCVADLEDELIRALGTDRVEAVIEAQGEMRALRTMQKQPAQQDRTVEQQLRRFIGTKSGRKLRYGALLVGALDLDRVPAPLDDLLTFVTT
jgi:hypothetical protein